MQSEIRAAFCCEPLSAAQRNILIRRTLGRDLKTIADSLHYTEQVVKNYLSEARHKLHARNNEEACWLARFSGQISDMDILMEYTREQAAD